MWNGWYTNIALKLMQLKFVVPRISYDGDTWLIRDNDTDTKKFVSIFLEFGIKAAEAERALSGLTLSLSNIRSSIRFECEIPDESLQCKIFEFPQSQDASLKLGDYYVNARRFLMSNLAYMSTVSSNNYKTFTAKRIKFNGLIHPCYVDGNGVKTEYIIRFISGFMAVCRKIENNEDNNVKENNSD